MFTGIIAKLSDLFKSQRGKNIVLFLSCLIISYLFWALLNLNNEIQQDFEIPVELVNKPDSITLIEPIPSTINVSVRDKGSNLIKRIWGRTAPIKLNFDDYSNKSHKLSLSKTDISARMRNYFGSNAQILSISPDSIRTIFTTLRGKLMKINVSGEITSHYQYVLGEIIMSTDSVIVYSTDEIPNTTKIETLPFRFDNLKDSVTFDAEIKQIPGMRIIPSTIAITIPVEPLISKKQLIEISVSNIPVGYNLITFPSKIEVDYLVPMSKYTEKNTDVLIMADFKDTYIYDKIPLSIINQPQYWQNISIKPDSVEYIIEQK